MAAEVLAVHGFERGVRGDEVGERQCRVAFTLALLVPGNLGSSAKAGRKRHTLGGAIRGPNVENMLSSCRSSIDGSRPETCKSAPTLITARLSALALFTRIGRPKSLIW